jgi:hypothetical protein
MDLSILGSGMTRFEAERPPAALGTGCPEVLVSGL